MSGRTTAHAGAKALVELRHEEDMEDPSLSEDTKCALKIKFLNVEDYVQEDIYLKTVQIVDLWTFITEIE